MSAALAGRFFSSDPPEKPSNFPFTEKVSGSEKVSNVPKATQNERQGQGLALGSWPQDEHLRLSSLCCLAEAHRVYLTRGVIGMGGGELPQIMKGLQAQGRRVYLSNKPQCWASRPGTNLPGVTGSPLQ